MHQMTTPALHRYHVLDRRHSNPRCSCPECASFDHSATMPMQRLPRPSSFSSDASVMMNTFDTETSEHQIYTLPSARHAVRASAFPHQASAPVGRQSEQPDTLRAFLQKAVMEKIERSVQAHPFLWFLVSKVLF